MFDNNRPNILLIYIKKDKQSKQLIKDIINKLSNSQKKIQYQQIYPFVYGLIDKKGYVLSILISVILCCVMLFINVEQSKHKLISVHKHFNRSKVMYHLAPKIINKINQSCKNTNCVKQFKTSQAYVLIELLDNSTLPSLPNFKEVKCNMLKTFDIVVCKPNGALIE